MFQLPIGVNYLNDTGDGSVSMVLTNSDIMKTHHQIPAA